MEIKESEYRKLVNKLYEQYLGDICPDEVNQYFKKWAKKNNYPLPKHIRFLKDMAYNCEGDTVPVIQETDSEVYYNDSCHRYCYLYKSDEGSDFEYVL